MPALRPWDGRRDKILPGMRQQNGLGMPLSAGRFQIINSNGTAGQAPTCRASFDAARFTPLPKPGRAICRRSWPKPDFRRQRLSGRGANGRRGCMRKR